MCVGTAAAAAAIAILKKKVCVCFSAFFDGGVGMICLIVHVH